MWGVLDQMLPLRCSLTKPFRTNVGQWSESLNPAGMGGKAKVGAGDTHVCWMEETTAFTTEHYEPGPSSTLLLNPAGDPCRSPASRKNQVGPRGV